MFTASLLPPEAERSGSIHKVGLSGVLSPAPPQSLNYINTGE